MKTNINKTKVKSRFEEEAEKIKPKKKMAAPDNKVNLKSKKFWNDVFDDEGEDIEKYIR